MPSVSVSVPRCELLSLLVCSLCVHVSTTAAAAITTAVIMIREYDERDSQALLKAAETVRKRAAIQQTKEARSAKFAQSNNTEAAAAPAHTRCSRVIMSKLKL
jgi:mRNA-degrading endonuclease toxin of MazEF toxin-antitoxin module